MKILAPLGVLLCLAVIIVCIAGADKAPADDAARKIAVKVVKARLELAKVDEKSCADEFSHYKREFERAKRLKGTNALSDTDYIEASRKYVRAEGEIARSKIRTAEAQALLEYTELTGDFDKALTLRHD